MALVDDSGRIDRPAVMREARRLYRARQGRADWSYADALRHAWSRAREARAARLAELRAFERLGWRVGQGDNPSAGHAGRQDAQ